MNFFLLTDYLLVNLFNETFFNLLFFIQIVKILPSNNTTSFVSFFVNIITNENNINLCYKVTYSVLVREFYAMAYRFDIENRYYKRYPIVQTKIYQYQYYEIDGIDKYKLVSVKLKGIK